MNSGAAQAMTANSIAALTLTDEAQVEATGSISIAAEGMGPSTLDLGGHILTVNVADNKVFRLMNCTATNGTVRVRGNNEKACLTFNETGVRAATVDFDLTTSLAPYVAATVHNLTLRSPCVYQDFIAGTNPDPASPDSVLRITAIAVTNDLPRPIRPHFLLILRSHCRRD